MWIEMLVARCKLLDYLTIAARSFHYHIRHNLSLKSQRITTPLSSNLTSSFKRLDYTHLENSKVLPLLFLSASSNNDLVVVSEQRKYSCSLMASLSISLFG